ncbi:MAG: Rieske (2Fe-2S) domain protein [Rariglobus sp.]|jgi:nitrite reductase/ring-hydroxylating ferredoxin subunit/uncharacterized membrane protein|nr:Rieske (2Fe-2S) domain protein [Rariglobus sp.]
MATPKEILEGKPLRSPLHPALVHLPIALFPLSLLLDLASWLWPRPELCLVRGAFIAIAAGIGTAVIAAIAGAVDYTSIRNDHPAKKTATWHMVLNVVAVGLFSASLGLRYGSLDLERTDLLPLLVSLAGLGVLGYSGYLGGHLVYSDGIGVGRHQRRTPLPEKTIERPAAKGKPVEIGAASLVVEGGTVRADVGGTVATVARSDGHLCAFQEFCTHRHGPLSEGKIENGEVVCPWHGSRFAMATGKVTEGPAKVDLRTFPVEEREGKIWLRTETPARPA